MSLKTFLRGRARRLRGDQGFSMVVTMGVVSMLTLSTFASYQAVQFDQPVAASDRQQKSAFAAAEAGLQVYVHKLLTNNSYWDQCAVPADGVNNVWNKPAATVPPSTPADPRTWKNLNDGSVPPRPTAAYTIETLPANGELICDKNRPEATVIDTTTATFRIRVTGQAVDTTGRRRGPKRSLIATFKRKSFLDYIYFTDYEVSHPDTYESGPPVLGRKTLENAGRNPEGPTQRSVKDWGKQACGKYAYQPDVRTGIFREDEEFRGNRSQNAGVQTPAQGGNPAFWSDHTAGCSEIRFVSGDSVQGPMHTNDSLLICGTPQFGRKPGDAIETSNPGRGTVASSYRVDTTCGTPDPQVNYENQPVRNNTWGTWRYNSPLLQLPASNSALAQDADPEYTFLGETTIVLGANGVTITGRRKDGVLYNNTRVGYPESGVIYVTGRTDPAQGPLCSGGYQLGSPYAARTGCGIANVSGEYNKSVTIGTSDDILIRGNIRRAAGTPALLGLIAQTFIRVYHPVVDQGRCNDNSGTGNGPGSLPDVRIDAALLTLRHSFIVDNYRCGSPLGDITVFGAISQKFRGPVGTGGRTSSTGYIKDYQYDDRLAVRSPPKFLDPVQSAWRIKTFQEQAPAQ